MPRYPERTLVVGAEHVDDLHQIIEHLERITSVR